MSDFCITHTNHTSFTVSSLDQTLAFFHEGLGFEIISRGPRDPRLAERITGVQGADIVVAYVRAPGHSIELIEYLSPADRKHIRPRPCDTGFSHLAFNIDNIDKAVTKAEYYEVYAIAPPVTIDAGPNEGCRIVYLRDRDGITIELIEAK